MTNIRPRIQSFVGCFTKEGVRNLYAELLPWDIVAKAFLVTVVSALFSWVIVWSLFGQLSPEYLKIISSVFLVICAVQTGLSVRIHTHYVKEWDVKEAIKHSSIDVGAMPVAIGVILNLGFGVEVLWAIIAAIATLVGVVYVYYKSYHQGINSVEGIFEMWPASK